MALNRSYKNHGEGLNQRRTQVINRSLVLNILRRTGVISRAELSRRSNLRQATITNITKELLALGYIYETGYLTGKGGRRSVGLAIDETKFRIIAARLTREHFTVGLFTVMGTELSETRRTVSVEGGPEKALDGIAEIVNAMTGEVGRDNVIGVGLAVPGPFSRPQSHILLVTGFPGWERISLRDELEKRINLPLVLSHDANAAAVAEWWTDAGNSGEYGSMLCFVGMQGVGGGIIINGQVLRGRLGTAGEIGHHTIQYDGPQCECGNRGCLEMYTSSWAIVKRYQDELDRPSPTHPITFHDVVQGFNNNDAAAVKAVFATAGYIAIGLANLVNILNPDLIVISGEIAEFDDRFVGAIRQELQKLLIPDMYKSVTVCRSAFGEDVAIRGVAMLVAEETLPVALPPN